MIAASKVSRVCGTRMKSMIRMLRWLQCCCIRPMTGGVDRRRILEHRGKRGRRSTTGWLVDGAGGFSGALGRYLVIGAVEMVPGEAHGLHHTIQYPLLPFGLKTDIPWMVLVTNHITDPHDKRPGGTDIAAGGSDDGVDLSLRHLVTAASLNRGRLPESSHHSRPSITAALDQVL